MRLDLNVFDSVDLEMESDSMKANCRLTARRSRRFSLRIAAGLLGSLAVMSSVASAQTVAGPDRAQMQRGPAAASESIFGPPETRMPDFADGQFVLPTLSAVTTATEKIGNGRLPDGFRTGAPSPTVMLPESTSERGIGDLVSMGNWKAPNTFSYPLYFEDRMLERHGHERWGCLQPLASGARFFATVPMLPYLSNVSPPCECEYKLGYYRVGSCAPVMLQRPPLERRAVIAEGAAIAGAIIAFP